MRGPTTPISFSAKARRTGEAPISTLISAVIANPGLISFAAGLVDAQTLPVAECLEITTAILSDPQRGRAALQYDTTIGLAGLREELVRHLTRLEGKELGIAADNLLVTTGSQQMLYLVTDVLIDPGDIVICADPTYFVYAGMLASMGARVLTVPMDDDGMDVEAVDRLLERLGSQNLLSRVKLVYCTSYFDNPTGLTLSLPRRKRLVEIVKDHSRDHRILILEDAAYRELCYDGTPLPSIKSFDPGNEWVILAQTFSKPFAPGIKLGYSVLPAEMHEAVLHQKGSHDFGSANLCQQIALEAMRNGSYAKHLEILKQEYRGKRDLLVQALQRHMPHDKGIHWTHPTGGLYVWLTLPSSIHTSRAAGANAGKGFFERCVERGVIYVPGEYCFQGQPVPHNHLRLSFGQVERGQIDEGVRRLAEVAAESIGEPEISRAKSAAAVGALEV